MNEPEAGPRGSGTGVLDAALLGLDRLGERATLVHFSSAFCQPCRATRRVLAEVGEMVEGVRHAEIDAEGHPELAERLGIRGTPAVLVLDAHGRQVRRAYGQPRRADVIAAIGAAAGIAGSDVRRGEAPGQAGRD
jgi:thiol-disulfide isomerase/thioredoxin